MFTSKEHLHVNLGVDMDIARFFVDRAVPVDNAYWKERYLYVSRGTGYLFIPLLFDLLYKCGIEKSKLFNPDFVGITEKILHSAARYELNEIGFGEHLDFCKSLIKGRILQPELYEDLLVFFGNEDLVPYKNLGTVSKPLNRADTYLFAFCCLDIEKDLLKECIQEWYALVPTFLLMDDITDLREDREKEEENSISDFGEGREGVEKAIDFLRENFRRLKKYNVLLGEYFERSLDKKIHTPYMQSILQ